MEQGTPIQSPAWHIQIRPARGWAALDLRELWQFRDLLVILMMRDVKLRYKQTALGVVWVVLQPLVASLIFAVISLITGILGFTGIAAGAATIAKTLFFLFLALMVIFLVLALFVAKKVDKALD